MTVIYVRDKNTAKMSRKERGTNKIDKHTSQLLAPTKMKWPAPHSPHSSNLYLCIYSALQLQNTDGLMLLQCAGPRWHVCENEAALYTDATSHVMHIPLKEGGQILQSTDHLFKQPFVLRPPAAGSN